MTRGRGTRGLEGAATLALWLLASTASAQDGAATDRAPASAEDETATTDAPTDDAPTDDEPTDDELGFEEPTDDAPTDDAPTDDELGFEEPTAPRGRPLVPPGGVPPIAGPQPPPSAPPPRPAPEEEPEPIPPPTYDVALHFRVGIPSGSGFDEALVAHRYDASAVIPIGYVGAAAALVEWLWIGGRLGTRGRTYGHPDRDEASLYATDLLLTAQVRFVLGRFVELGVLVAGGASYIEVRVNGALTDQVTARFGAEATVAFRIGRNFALGPRVGWDYFQWENMNAYGDGVDLGGAWLGVALEGRE